MSPDDDLNLEADIVAAIEGELDAGKPAEIDTPSREYNRDEAGRFAQKQAEEAAAAARDEQVAQAQQPGVQAQPGAKPAWKPTWYKDEYGPWDKLAEPFRNALRDQEKAYANGIAQHSAAAKSWEPVTKVLEPYQGLLQQAGISAPQYVESLINADKYLRESPIEALNWLAQSYAGLDIIALADKLYQQGYQAPAAPDPRDQKIQLLEQRLNQFEASGQQAKTAALEAEIQAWAKDKPDFAAVRPYMASLAKQNPQASLDELYESARYAHPETRDRILKEIEDKRLADLKGKRQAGAQSPRGVPQPDAAPRKSRSKSWNIEADVAEAYDEASA